MIGSSEKEEKQEIHFTINGKSYTVNSSTVPIDTSLNSFIRNNAQLKGTRYMCYEGGCGACVVAIRRVNPTTRQKTTWSANSCLLPLYACDGNDIITVEGLGNRKDGYHILQQRLAYLNGTQCGFCSSGMIMNMFSLLEANNGVVSAREVENSFGGNICRCTGYRPILDAFKSFAADAPRDILQTCRDIEDLHKICPSTGLKCLGSCSAISKQNQKPKIRVPFDDGKEWHKVASVNEIFEIFQASGDTPYMLVGGNTATGVYRRNANIAIFIDVNDVAELHAYSIEEDMIKLGGNMTLNNTMRVLEQAANTVSDFSYAREIVKHMDLIAHVSVRNVGTLGGNLSIKHEYKEFPSDIFIILEALDAKILLAPYNETSYIVDPIEYLDVDMDKTIIREIHLPALDPKIYDFRSYKIMIRAQNAHAYVNAGFLFKYTNESKEYIAEARICFGGISPEFVHAKETEEFLIGKPLSINVTIQMALQHLFNEINPDLVLPDASPVYRKHLALALFYRAVLSIVGETKLRKDVLSAKNSFDRPLSSGKQEFDTYPKYWPLTQYIPKLEALAQCSGEAEYINDIPERHDELGAAFVTATQARAKILDIDPSEALAFPGVVAFFSAKDIPGRNDFGTPKFGQAVEEIFCSDKTLFYGQPLGMIVAESSNIANQAARLVKVSYEETNEPICTSIEEIYEAKQLDRIKPGPLTKRSTKTGTKRQLTISDSLSIGSQYHYNMETQICLTIPTEQGLDIHSSTQWMDHVQLCIADALKIPENQINIYVKRLGGAYGSKISRATQIACASALAAHLLNRPVRLVLQLRTNMESIGKRNSALNQYDVQTDAKGKIQMLKNFIIEDFGCSPNDSPFGNVKETIPNVYDNASWEYFTSIAYTDKPSSTWCRAPGTVEGLAMTETIMEHIAFELNLDPNEVRMANMTEDSKMKKLLPEFLTSVEYAKRKSEIEAFNKENRWRKRGIGTIVMKYTQGFSSMFSGFVSIFHGDGTVSVTHGGIEMGQGLNTKVAATVAHLFGIPLDMISIKTTNSNIASNNTVTGGSQGSEMVCGAIKKACEIMLLRLKPYKDKNKNATWQELIRAAYSDQIDLTANGTFSYKDGKSYDIWGLSCAEVEVDILTGNLILNRVDIVEDVGESLSPGVDVGQIEGAFVMGLGYWLTEELIYDKNGALLTNRTWNYKPIGAKDIPVDFRVKFLQKSSNPYGVLRSKATGEPATCMAIVVVFALRHALNSARENASLERKWINFGSAITPEKIFLAAGNDYKQYLLN